MKIKDEKIDRSVVVVGPNFKVYNFHQLKES